MDPANEHASKAHLLGAVVGRPGLIQDKLEPMLRQSQDRRKELEEFIFAVQKRIETEEMYARNIDATGKLLDRFIQERKFTVINSAVFPSHIRLSKLIMLTEQSKHASSPSLSKTRCSTCFGIASTVRITNTKNWRRTPRNTKRTCKRTSRRFCEPKSVLWPATANGRNSRSSTK